MESATWSDEGTIQRKSVEPGAGDSAFGNHRENKTGLPDKLKAGIETLSGLAMDDVNVHRNSSKPAQLRALAYTQGTDIHLGPGQERHLPHEAWHVVQQRQGRVRPTFETQGVTVNDDASLEREADVMGQAALRQRHSEGPVAGQPPAAGPQRDAPSPVQTQVVQRINGGGEQELSKRKSPTRKGKKAARKPVSVSTAPEESDEIASIAASGDESDLALDEVNIDIGALERLLEQQLAEKAGTKAQEKGATDDATAGPPDPELEATGRQDKFAELEGHRAVTEQFLAGDVMPDEEKLEEIDFQIGYYKLRIESLPAQIRSCMEELKRGAKLLEDADENIAEMEETETKVNAVGEALARPIGDVQLDESDLALIGGQDTEDPELAELEAGIEPEELPMTAGMRAAYEKLEVELEEGAQILEALTERLEDYVKQVDQYLQWLQRERQRIQPPAAKQPRNRYGIKSKAKKGATKALQVGSLFDVTPATALINKGRQVVALCKTIKHNRQLQRIAESCKDADTQAAIRYAASQKKKKARRLAMQVGMLGPAVAVETGYRRFKKGRSEERNKQARLLWNKAKDGDPAAIAAVRDLTKRNYNEVMRRDDGWKIVADKMKSK